MKFADPKNDIAFKKVFGNENQKEVLISFLNSVLDFKGEEKIAKVIIGTPYQLPDIKELKETILDIKATNEKGEKFIVEMQKKNSGNFAKRSIYYTSKAYISQVGKAVDFDKLNKVYYIALVDFNIFEGKEFISRHLIINQETGIQDLKDFEFTFVELKKFKTKLKDCDTIIKKWIYFINNAADFDLMPKEFENIPEIKTAFETVNRFSWDKKEMDVYDYIAKKQADERGVLKTAKNKAFNKGIEKGIEKGIKKRNIELAKNSITQGLDDKTISLITGLSLKEIKSLKS